MMRTIKVLVLMMGLAGLSACAPQASAQPEELMCQGDGQPCGTGTDCCSLRCIQWVCR